ncbi:amino acid ABC transporter permease [Burkholderia gladioli]|uniref:amino acid ABC transporter permease n=1 Tax=Burkholderia gladioli TaxID=28095 RepID=UPI000CFFAD0E|nr:amino acid ABC transporter permease [Burkholderia gladioli]MDN7812732.1 amino acid ABC transporter permease [Burkholderia gladioli]PRG56442.1 ABC transporter permease [Burkholderia gladioli]PRH04044.1 ABC transporter permease [Burkholderia gladioli]
MTTSSYLALLQGAGVSLLLALCAVAVGIPLGLLLALARWRRVPVLDGAITAYVSVMRPTPVVTLCLLVFFVMPAAGLDLPPMAAAALALSLNTTAFNCEIWRAALLALPADQLEAGAAFGFSGWQTLVRIVLPQLWRASLGPLVSEITLLLKITPAASVIGIVDITRAAGRIGADTYDPLPPFLAATVLYTLIIALGVQGQRLLERRAAQRYGYLSS